MRQGHMSVFYLNVVSTFISKWRRGRPSLRCVMILSVLLVASLFLLTLDQLISPSGRLPENLKEPGKKIIVVSYMRSGSTLTADLIQQHPGVFYVFEPLYTIEKITKGYLTPLYLNKPSGLIRMEYTAQMKTIKSFLTCSLSDVDLLTLHQHHMDKSRSTESFSKCAHQTSLNQFESTCLRGLTEQCHNSEVTLVKTIRYKMESTEELLVLHPNLQVVLLIRDPRATLFSRARLFQNAATRLEAMRYHMKQAATHCNSVLRDVRDAARLSSLYPGRVAILLYEKFVENPKHTTKLLYDFLGLTYSKRIESYVHNITEAGLPDNCPVCTTRGNSTQTATKWRHGLSFADVSSIDRVCQSVYSKLGYIPFPDSDTLYNLNVPSWQEIIVPALITDKVSLIH